MGKAVLEDGDGKGLASSFLTDTTFTNEAMKHGVALEPAAKQAVKEQLREVHQGCEFQDSGLVVDKDHPFLAASLDLVVDCSCCGRFLVEIKCPYTVRNTVPTAENVNYICVGHDGEVKLKEKHQYYGQIQGQLAIAGGRFCVLFIYTHHGHLLIKVDGSQPVWIVMLPKLTWFWQTLVAPKLLSSSILATDNAAMQPPATPFSVHPLSAQPPVPPSITRPSRLPVSVPPMSAQPPVPQSTTRPSRLPVSVRPLSPKARKTSSKVPAYLCGSCGGVLKEDPLEYKDFSIGCDRCPQWYHFKCVGIRDGHEPSTDEWKCQKCSA